MPDSSARGRCVAGRCSTAKAVGIRVQWCFLPGMARRDRTLRITPCALARLAQSVLVFAVMLLSIPGVMNTQRIVVKVASQLSSA